MIKRNSGNKVSFITIKRNNIQKMVGFKRGLDGGQNYQERSKAVLQIVVSVIQATIEGHGF